MLFSKVHGACGAHHETKRALGNLVYVSGVNRAALWPSLCSSSHHFDHQNQQRSMSIFRRDKTSSSITFTNYHCMSLANAKSTMISRWIHKLSIVRPRCVAVYKKLDRHSDTAMSIWTLHRSPSRLYSTQKKGGESDNNNNANDYGAASSTGAKVEGGISNRTISTITIKDDLGTKESVNDFLTHLTDDQKRLLYHSLNIDVLRDKYEGHLGSSKSESHQFLSRFGRPAAALIQEDPTGTLCEVPPKWLHARLDEKSPPPSASAVWAVGLKNALPFIGFGFLDNLIMILAGDWIDLTLGTALGISTMAAAALGNTISDVAGIGSAWYIEELASKIGIKDPELTPSQFASWPIRWASNGGRAIGVVIGCLLGMIPLLFLPSNEDKEKEKADQKEAAANSAAVGKSNDGADKKDKK